MTRTRMTVARRTKPANDTRRKLIAAASQLMIERDSVHVPFSSIAQRAGVNSALIKYHFGNKDGLLVAVALDGANEIIESLDALAFIPPNEALLKYISLIVDANYQKPYMNTLCVSILRDFDRDHAKLISDEVIQPLSNVLRRILKEGEEGGYFEEFDTMIIFYAVHGAAMHLFSSRASLEMVFQQDGIDGSMVQRAIDQITRIFAKGMAR